MRFKFMIAIVLAVMVAQSTQEVTTLQTFPEVLWTYWDGDLSNPKTEIFLKLCFNNMREYAVRSGWKFHLTTNDNLHEFLSRENYDNCLKLLALVGMEFKQKRADIIRLYLLKENGGMWIDSSTFFIEELRWVNQIRSTNIPIINRIGDSLDLITFRMGPYDKPDSQVFDPTLGMDVIVSPGLQNWAIIAKPNTTFINDALTLIRQMLIQGDTYLDQIIRNHGVQLSLGANNSYYKFGVYTFQIVLQVKQSQLNSVPDSGRSKYAVADYKIWTIDSGDMGFCLEAITDGITPFVSATFLFSNMVKIQEDYKIKLSGFIKLGGIKRWYIEMIIKAIINPEMCQNFLSDTFRLNNQSYLYHYMIKDNQQPNGLALKNNINHSIRKEHSQEKVQCQMSIQNQQQLQHASSIINFLYLGSILALVATLTLFCRSRISCMTCPISQSGDSMGCVNRFRQFWNRYRSLCLWGIAVILIILGISIGSKGSTHDVCSGVAIWPDFQQMELSKKYLSEMRDSLPQDNGTFLQMFFHQYIQKLTDDLSTFAAEHSLQFLGYFQEYIAGTLLCAVMALAGATQLPARMRSQVAKLRFGLGFIRAVLLLLLLGILLFSCIVVARSFLLKTKLNESICYFTKIPEYLSENNNTVAENQPLIVNFLTFEDILSRRFETISMILIAFKGNFVMKSKQYRPALEQVKLKMLPSLQNQELSRLLDQKRDLISAFQSQLFDLTDSLICENRVIEVMKLFTDYLKNIIRRGIFFLDHFTSLEKISFIATSIPIAFSLLCMLNSLTLWRFVLSKGKVRPQERRSFMKLGIAGLALSLVFNCLVLSNYYFCDFVTAFKVSLEDSSSNYLEKIIPIKCMSDTTSDILLQTLEQNFKLRKINFQHFVDLNPQIDSLTSYPFDRERQLLEAYSEQNQAHNFLASNDEYNEMLHRFSREYYERKQEVEADLSKKYTIGPRNSLIKEIETALYQPLCVFNFTTLYQLVALFKYLGFLNLFAFFASLLLPQALEEKPPSVQHQFQLFEREQSERGYCLPQIEKSSLLMTDNFIEDKFDNLYSPTTTD